MTKSLAQFHDELWEKWLQRKPRERHPHYVEFECSGNFEVSRGVNNLFHISSLWGSLHRFNSQCCHTSRLAIAFPDYRLDEYHPSESGLGSRIRFFGYSEDLNEFLNGDRKEWLGIFGRGLRPNVEISETPKDHAHVIFTEISEQYEHPKQCHDMTPLIYPSASVLVSDDANGSRITLSVARQEVPRACNGIISDYGLSDRWASVPHF